MKFLIEHARLSRFYEYELRRIIDALKLDHRHFSFADEKTFKYEEGLL